jgi:hypothetical protein
MKPPLAGLKEVKIAIKLLSLIQIQKKKPGSVEIGPGHTGDEI